MLPVHFADIVDTAHVRMRESAREPDLGEETLEVVALIGETSGQTQYLTTNSIALRRIPTAECRRYVRRI